MICGWVGMWRPLEIFLYGWWPIRAEIQLYERLGAMPIRIAYRGSAALNAWQHDWPVVPPARVQAQLDQPQRAKAAEKPAA